MRVLPLLVSMLVATAGGAVAQPASTPPPCAHTIGMVVSLTGPAARFGLAAAKAVELAFRDFETAGGVAGCRLAIDLRDAQSQGAVAAEQARALIETRHVPAIIGGVLSMETLAMLTGVTVKAGVVQISPTATSPTLTRLAREGKTGGWFFRVAPSNALQGVAMARLAVDKGIGSVAIIHVDSDGGAATAAEFRRAFGALGGKVMSVTPYAQNQLSYATEVEKALAGAPEALYLVALPADGTNIARGWLDQRGPAAFLFSDSMKSADFLRDAAPRTLERAFGVAPARVKTASTAYFAKAYRQSAGRDADAPAADRAYDAAALLGLAIAVAGKPEPAAIRDGLRSLAAPDGTAIGAGPEEFRRALQLIADRKPIRYVGVVGPLRFDRNGDVAGPFTTWAVRDGAAFDTGEIAIEEIERIKGMAAAQ